ncbi:MAG TPA: winged helix-turn-helix domain-containing protein [Terriglobales bacterium]|nr:winged helix-turn-helix domain-containing protein [Terriglobales bacterium]
MGVDTEIIRFGDFELDRGAFELRENGRVVRLERIPLELLFLLAEQRGRLVTREQILDCIWGKDVFVDVDNGINTAVRKVRQALRENPEKPRLLQTVPGKGYRFVAPGSIDRTTGKVMLVVLPFVNLSGDSREDFFADGMTEEMVTQLGSLDPLHLGVIARTTSMQYKGSGKSTAQIAQELGVNFLLEGSVRREGERVRVTAQLIQASDQTHVWADSFDREQSDVIRLQSDVALAIAGKIELSLPGRVRARLIAPRPVNAQAHMAYLEGLQLWELRTKLGMEQSITRFQRAISLDPNYAPAYAALARAYTLASVPGMLPAHESMPKAREAALRAIALDDSLAEGHTVLAFVKAQYEYDKPGAEREYLRALELNPNNGYAHLFYSNSYLSLVGRHDEATAEMKRAIELDPFSAPIQSFLIRTYTWARRYDEALAQFHKCHQMFPDFALNHERLAHLYTYTGRFEEAIAEDSKARLLARESPESVRRKEDELRRAWKSSGAPGYWRTLLEFAHMPENPPEAYVPDYGVAILYTRLGETDKAVESLEMAFAKRELAMTEIGVEPAFDSLCSDPRFQSLLRRVGLAL